jgi:hypothetical protein
MTAHCGNRFPDTIAFVPPPFESLLMIQALCVAISIRHLLVYSTGEGMSNLRKAPVRTAKSVGSWATGRLFGCGGSCFPKDTIALIKAGP